MSEHREEHDGEPELPGSQGKKGNKMSYNVLKGGDTTVL